MIFFAASATRILSSCGLRSNLSVLYLSRRGVLKLVLNMLIFQHCHGSIKVTIWFLRSILFRYNIVHRSCHCAILRQSLYFTDILEYRLFSFFTSRVVRRISCHRFLGWSHRRTWKALRVSVFLKLFPLCIDFWR